MSDFFVQNAKIEKYLEIEGKKNAKKRAKINSTKTKRKR